MNNIVCSSEEHKHGTCKRFWSFLKSFRNESCGVASLKENGTLKSSAKEKSEILNKQFSSVLTNYSDPNLPNVIPSPFTSISKITEIYFKE